MPLRIINDVIAPSAVVAALSSVMLPNTTLAANGGKIYANQTAALNQLTAQFPTVVLDEAPQSSARIAYRTWQTKLQVRATYYDRYDQQTAQMDTIWANIDADLRLMKANVEDNPLLKVNGVRNCESVVQFQLSTYEGEALTKADSPFQVPVVMRRAIILVNCLPYLSAT